MLCRSYNSKPNIAKNWNKANVVAFRAMRSFGSAIRPHLPALSSTPEHQVGHGQGEWDDWDRDVDFDEDFGDEETQVAENKGQHSPAVQSSPKGIKSSENENLCKPWNEDAPYFDDELLEEHVHVMGKSVSQRIGSNIISATASVNDAKKDQHSFHSVNDNGVEKNRSKSDGYPNQSFPWINQRFLDAVQSITSILQSVAIIYIALSLWKLRAASGNWQQRIVTDRGEEVSSECRRCPAHLQTSSISLQHEKAQQR